MSEIAIISLVLAGLIVGIILGTLRKTIQQQGRSTGLSCDDKDYSLGAMRVGNVLKSGTIPMRIVDIKTMMDQIYALEEENHVLRELKIDAIMQELGPTAQAIAGIFSENESPPSPPENTATSAHFQGISPVMLQYLQSLARH